MQVDPNAASAVYMHTPGGAGLALDPGREVTARIVAAGNGSARISLAGQQFDVSTDAQLRAGDTIRLSITAADETGVRLAIVSPETGSAAGGAHSRGAQVLGALARAGVPVTAPIAHAVDSIVQQLGGDSASARAVASLAGRDLALSPAGAGRVAAALEVAGTLGPSLASLASRSSEVAAALPAGVPTATALRSLLAPNLAPAELGVARIVQAMQSSIGAPAATLATPPSSSAAVIQNYLASQVALNASLDSIATRHLQMSPGAASSIAPPALPPAPVVPGTPIAGITNAALTAAVRGEQAAVTAGAPAAAASARPAPPAGVAPPALNPATGPVQTSATSTANAAASTGAAAAAPTPTSPRAAAAVADLANLAVRFAPAVAAGTGAIGSAAAAAGRGINAADVAQQIGQVGSAGVGVASVAGAGVSGDPAPLVHAMRAFLAAPGTQGDAARLLQGLAGADPRALAAAVGTLSESDSLRLAGTLLELLPGTQQLTASSAEQLKRGVHQALESLGRSFQPAHDAAARDLATLRAALEQVAANDPRPGVAADAARLLAATDGQQILSRTAAGADPGYVYFQVPMPDGRGAEVMVRREPGRRVVSFDEFNIAFLLNTAQVGTLMIQLDAHPAGIRADVRTDIPELEPYLRAQSDALIEPLTREARRPVVVTTGVFEQDPPASLLEPTLGLIEPGAREFYA